ncbi:hypothetical protein A3Q56_02463, partial [Intoshia linei]
KVVNFSLISTNNVRLHCIIIITITLNLIHSGPVLIGILGGKHQKIYIGGRTVIDILNLIDCSTSNHIQITNTTYHSLQHSNNFECYNSNSIILGFNVYTLTSLTYLGKSIYDQRFKKRNNQENIYIDTISTYKTKKYSAYSETSFDYRTNLSVRIRPKRKLKKHDQSDCVLNSSSLESESDSEQHCLVDLSRQVSQSSLDFNKQVSSISVDLNSQTSKISVNKKDLNSQVANICEINSDSDSISTEKNSN